MTAIQLDANTATLIRNALNDVTTISVLLQHYAQDGKKPTVSALNDMQTSADNAATFLRAALSKA